MATSDGFFAVGRDTFARACAIDAYAAATFLVLARGSGADNITTRWSAKATADRLGVRWTKANEAIGSLVAHRLVQRTGKAKSNPSYKIMKVGNLIWLPNSLVDGVSDQPSPLARLRQTHDPMVIRLLVELYDEQNLREDGGISTNLVRSSYVRKRLGQHAQFVVWGFDPDPDHSMTITWGSPTTKVHYRPESALSEEERTAGKNSGIDFFRRFEHLMGLGLVSKVPMLLDGPRGEPVHPIHHTSDIAVEVDLANACIGAGQRALSDEHHEILDQRGWPEIVAAVPAHIEQVTLEGTYRLRYRPHTRLTAAWWADLNCRTTSYVEQYNSVAPEHDWRNFASAS